MTAITNLHSGPEAGRSNELHKLAVQLYALLACGHDSLAYNVDAQGAALTLVGADGQRRAVRGSGEGEGSADRPPWQRARELIEGGERDRRFNPWVLERHLAGRYSVAPASAGWVGWVALDIDAHPAPGSPELVARRLARARADRVLASVWRALGCSAERHPLVLRSPGGGYHVWLPLTRGEASSNPEHTWPAAVARAWVERHLVAAGLKLAPGVLEVFPSGRCLRSPCGRGMTLLQATRPSDPDALGLAPWPGTMGEARVDWRGERAELLQPVRRVVPMARTFVAQWAAQRRTIADWLGRPEAAWDPAWGFLGWRDAEDTEIAGEISSAEKNRAGEISGQDSRSQESDDVPGRQGAGVTSVAKPGRGGAGRLESGDRSASSIPDELLTPSAPDPDLPLDPADGPLVRGRAFKVKVRTLVSAGITAPSTRHDAVLTLGFYWYATCGLSLDATLVELAKWCRAHPHQGSQLAARPRAFLATCVREAQHYIEHYGPKWRFRGRGDAGGLATLTPADHAVIRAVDPRLVDEVTTILAWLAGRAGDDGGITDPVEIASGLLKRLCGDRRIAEDGKRRRASSLALVELERVGVLTMASNYRVGQRGRTWSCWYRFGSGELPRAVSLPAKQWEQIAPFTSAPLVPSPFTSAPLVPSLAVVPSKPPETPCAPLVEVRVLGERVVPEGLLHVLSDGARGAPRTLLMRAPDVERPTATPAARAPWFERAYLLRPFTPRRLWSADPAMVIAFPDLEARRRMPRRERLAWGGGTGGPSGGGTGGPSGGGVPGAPVIPLRSVSAAASSPAIPSSPIATTSTEATSPAGDPPDPGAMSPDRAAVRVEELRAELADAGAAAAPAVRTMPPGAGRSEHELRADLAALVGEGAAAAVPISLLEVMCHAWGGARGRGS